MAPDWARIRATSGNRRVLASQAVPAKCRFVRSSRRSDALSVRARVSNDADTLGAGFRYPCLTLAAQQLPYVGTRAIAREALELFGQGVKAHDTVGSPVREPDLVVGINPDGVGARPLAGKLPAAPILGSGVVDADVAGVPLADPQPAFRIRPYAAREIGTFSLRTKGEKPQEVAGKYVVVWEKDGNDWKLAADIWNEGN